MDALDRIIDESTAQITKQGSFVIKDDEAIVNYIVDTRGSEMLSSFQHRPENTGVAVFFHDIGHCKDLIVIIRTKYFDEPDNNGLIMMISKSIYCNADRKDELVELMRTALKDNTHLRDEVIMTIEGHVMKSIQINA